MENALDLAASCIEEDAEGARVIDGLRTHAEEAEIEVRLWLLGLIPHVSWHVFTIR
jgi:hypothetical protein